MFDVSESDRGSSAERCQELDLYQARLDQLVKEYSERNGTPVEVNFRELVRMHSGIDRATHLMHASPAKLLLNIPHFFLNVRTLVPTHGIVLDPFCGTGTVLVESLLSGRRAIGADSNPLARLIALAKSTPLIESNVIAAHKRVMARVGNAPTIDFSPVVEASRWFAPSTTKAMAELLGAIRGTRNLEILRFFEVCFSACIRRLSFADPRLSVPVSKGFTSKPPPGRSAQERLLTLYEKTVRANLKRLSQLPSIAANSRCNVFKDARTLPDDISDVAPDGVDFVITSPPYVGAQKYIRSSSLSIGWLGLAPDHKLRALERGSIGREHYDKKE